MKKIIYTIVASAATMLSIYAKAQTISTYAGDSLKSLTYSGDGSAATAAGMRLPAGAATDAVGNLYIADRDNHVIRMVNTVGIISTIAGTGTSGIAGDGGAATAAQLSQPVGVNFDAAGNLYIAEYGSHKIRKVNSAGVITTVAGVGISGYSGDGSAATAAKISYPTDIAFDAAGNMYISDYNNSVVRKVDGSGVISTFAGGGSSYTDGIPATDASFYGNNGVRVDASGNVIITDMNNNRIVKVTPAGLCYTIAGDGTGAYTGDGGDATAAQLDYPTFLETDKAGNIFFSDADNAVVRKIDASGVITTIAGNHTIGNTGDGGPATAASIAGPAGLCFSPSGDLYLVCQSYSVVRKIAATPIGLSGTTTLCRSNTAVLSGAVSGGVWSSSNPSVATVSTTGMVTAVAAGTATISYALSLGFGSTAFTVNDCPTEVAPLVVDGGSLSIFPNPAISGQFLLNVPAATNMPVHVVITNMLGKQVKELTVKANSPLTVSIDVPGVYFLSATTETGKYTAKLIVQ